MPVSLIPFFLQIMQLRLLDIEYEEDTDESDWSKLNRAIEQVHRQKLLIWLRYRLIRSWLFFNTTLVAYLCAGHYKVQSNYLLAVALHLIARPSAPTQPVANAVKV